ncbi:uncharacterized protein LOC125725334 isoform X2 [Brienomyrus brachyistius]|uniref:uncharacterized protein LOC125725334 isoform X2 n=1 Tax=Brienomyrus brachyistius TaxID=42636 RepID=UPI0020B235B5|nr:uncharacterized protein LOC125725334 isoform X2 [Brienomyrus brachyistius]
MEKERRKRRAASEMRPVPWGLGTPVAASRNIYSASHEMRPPVGCNRKSTESVLMERADSPVPSCVSLKSDRSIGISINFREGPFPTDQSVLMERADSPVPSCVSLKSDRSIGIPINFREGPFPTDQRDQMEECSSDLHDKSDLSAISKSLQEKAVKFLKDELKKFVRYLDQNYPECSEPQLEEDNDLDSDGQMQKTCGREEALKITLYILRTMKQNDLADMLEKRLMLQYQREIKRKLKKQFECVFEGKAKEGQPTLLSEIYTELYITEGGTGGVNEEHEVRQIETASKKRRTEDTTVKCNDIFKPLCGRETPIRTVLSKGVAGIGKTVSVQKFILDWAEGKANQDVHFIFALPFRDLNLIKDEYSLIELLHRFVPELKSFQSIELFRYKVLFIFDGLDECRLPLDFQNNESWFDVTKKMSLDVLLTNLIKGNLLPSALLWITSRPAASNQIPPKCVHRVTEIRGFSDAQKEEYFRRRFSDQSLASRIITHVKSSRSLFIMCHIPVFCWISATVLERLFSETDRGEIPRTLTEMYTHFLIFQYSLKNDKYMKNYETKLKEYSKEILLKLGKLAFDNLEKGNLIFYEQDLTENGIDVTEASVYSGLCTEVFKEEYGLYQEKVYCFVHLSIQEYLAALYVFQSNLSADLLETAVDQALKSKNGHLDLYLRFLLGLSTDSSRTLLQKLLGETRIGSHTIKEMEQYIHPSNVCSPVSSGLLGSEAFPQSSVPMAWNNPGWDASLSHSQYIHPYNICPSLFYSEPLGSEAFPQSSVPMAGYNPGWGVNLSQPQYIHPSNVFTSMPSGLLWSEAFPQSSVPMAWNNPGWDASLSQPQYIHPSNVCPPVSSGLLGTEAFPQSSVPMTGTDLELGASLSLAEYIKKKIQKKLSPERTINLFHCLVELGDSSLIQEVQRYLNSGNLSAEDLSPAQYSALAFVMLMSDEELDVFDMKKYIRPDEEHWRLLPVVKNSRTALLKSCGLTNEHCEMLTSALRSNSSPLRELDLSDNDLKNKGVMLLSAGLGDSHCKLGLLRSVLLCIPHFKLENLRSVLLGIPQSSPASSVFTTRP